MLMQNSLPPCNLVNVVLCNTPCIVMISIILLLLLLVPFAGSGGEPSVCELVCCC